MYHVAVATKAGHPLPQYIGSRVTRKAWRNLAEKTLRATGRTVYMMRNTECVRTLEPTPVGAMWRAEQDAKHITPDE